jgi:DNA-binding NarL/FixJ family response regulator
VVNPPGPGGARRVRVVIVDDHEAFARGLALLLDVHGESSVEVVGYTSRAEEAADLVARELPDLAVVDLSMPGPGGLHAVREIKTAFPDVAVLALTASEESSAARAAFSCGADGFAGKSTSPGDLIAPMLAVCAGQVVLPRWLATELLASDEYRDRELLDSLSAEDRRLLALIAHGVELAGISEDMSVSERTAKRMVAAVVRRVGATNRSEAAAIAGRLGLWDVTLPAG